jgi:crotonobetainyl-CoA:carnitine CoA-transferase CaiB-like acyl-CoA transferase
MSYPLEGVKILDFGIALAAPFAGLLLADMGAEVIKVERVDGEPQRYGLPAGMDDLIASKRSGDDVGSWIMLNRGKKDLAINLKKERAKEIILKLAGEADAVLHSSRPGVMERLGLGYEDLSRVNPKIVYCSLTGFGETGPLAHRAGGDMWAQAMSGMVSIQGEPGGPPHMVGFSLVDCASGMMTAFAVMVALFARERTGMGQEVNLNLLNVSMYLQLSQLTSYLTDGNKVYKEGRGTAGQPPPFAPFRAKDGDVLTIFGADPLWPKLCEILGVEELAHDERFATNGKRREHRREMDRLLDEAFSRKTRAEWAQAFKEAKMRCDPCLTYEELCAHPQVQANEMIINMEHPVRGNTKLLGVPVKLKKTPAKPRCTAPLLGQHTAEILLGLGYTKADIAQLEAEGVVKTG